MATVVTWTRADLTCIDFASLIFDVLLTVHLNIFISVINQLDAQNFCFTISLFLASTCFEHMCCCSLLSHFPKTLFLQSLSCLTKSWPTHSIRPYQYHSSGAVPSYSSIVLLIIVLSLFALNWRPSRAIPPFPLAYSFPQIVIFVLPCVPYFSLVCGISVLY